MSMQVQNFCKEGLDKLKKSSINIKKGQYCQFGVNVLEWINIITKNSNNIILFCVNYDYFRL